MRKRWGERGVECVVGGGGGGGFTRSLLYNVAWGGGMSICILLTYVTAYHCSYMFYCCLTILTYSVNMYMYIHRGMKLLTPSIAVLFTHTPVSIWF